MAPTFFAQPPVDSETLAKQSFFLRYHGNGITLADVHAMTFMELQREVKLLHDQLTAEKNAHEEAVRAAKTKRR